MDIQLDEEKILNSFLKLLTISSHSQQEASVAAFIKEWCGSLHIDILEDDTREKTGSNSGNLICTIKGTDKDITPIFFTAHMDTIKTGHVSPYVVDGYVQTDGSTALGADDKAGTIALLEGIKYIINSNASYGDIQLIFTVCEEQGLVGARAMDKRVIKGKFGYTIDADEPVGTCITHSAAIDIVTITITTKSKDEGNNIHQAISNIIRLIAKRPVPEGLHVSIIGFQENKSCMYGGIDLTIELKSMNHHYIQYYADRLKQFTKKSVQSTQLIYTMDVEHICNNYQYDTNDSVLALASHAAKSLDLPLRYKHRFDVSDANVFTTEYMPTMTLGAGFEHIHTNKERISISQLYDLTRYIIAIALCRDAE